MLERLLVVGLGSIGRRHARLARSIVPGLQVVALRHRDAGNASEPGIDRCVSTLADALAFRPQAAVIANPASQHLEVAMALARAGIHLLVEKPISNATRGVTELIEECRGRELTLMTGYNLRFLPSLRKFQQCLAVRRVGRILSVRAEVGQFLPSWRPGSDYRQAVSARAELGGGVLLELSHEIDYLRWLFGEAAWVGAVERRQSDLEIDVEDTAHIVLAFADETQGPPTVAALSMDFVRHDATRCCIAIGESGSLRWNGIAGTVEVFEQGADDWQTLFVHRQHADESYIAEWRHFLQCVADGSAPLISGHDGLAVLRIVETARASARRGSIVLLGHEGAAVSSGEPACKSSH
jgi:predicted dehydrogenase